MIDFKSTKIHPDTKGQLESFLLNDKVPHAMLFLGKAGFNSLYGAVAFANRLLCLDPQGINSCGQCSACLKTQKIIHPDLHFSFPVGKHKTKKRDKTTSLDFLPNWRELLIEGKPFDIKDWQRLNDNEQSLPNINVEECNNIITKLSLQAFESEKKIVIIWLPEYLRNEGNRLLKLIEEPTNNTHLILVAEDSASILNTIISRVQIIKYLPLLDEQIKEELLKVGKGSDVMNTTLPLAEGDLLKAYRLSEGSVDHDYESLINWLRFIYNIEKQPQSLVKWTEDFSRRSKDYQLFFLEYSIRFMHQLHRAALLSIDHSQLSREEKVVAEKILKLLDVDKIDHIVKELDTLVTLLNRNANMKIAIMGAGIRVGHLLKQQSIDKLLY